MTRAAGAAALALVVGGALSACTPLPRADDLVGTWLDDAGNARLVLATGGRCTADALEATQGPVTGRCRWTMGSEVDGARADDGAPLVELDFSGDADAGVGRVDFGLRDGGQELSYRDAATDTTVAVHRR